MARPSSKPTGAVWTLVDEWARQHPLQPNQRQVAGLLGISTSLLSAWKYRQTMVQMDDVLHMSERFGLPLGDVAAAAAEDARHVVQRRNDHR